MGENDNKPVNYQVLSDWYKLYGVQPKSAVASQPAGVYGTNATPGFDANDPKTYTVPLSVNSPALEPTAETQGLGAVATKTTLAQEDTPEALKVEPGKTRPLETSEKFNNYMQGGLAAAQIGVGLDNLFGYGKKIKKAQLASLNQDMSAAKAHNAALAKSRESFERVFS